MEDSIKSLIKKWLLDNLKRDNKVTVTWDCGDDESFVYPSVNDVEIEPSDFEGYEFDMHEEIGWFITEKLNIPDAGEFSMQGRGNIFIENDKIVITYQTEGEGIIGFDDKSEAGIWGNFPKEEGKEILFDTI